MILRDGETMSSTERIGLLPVSRVWTGVATGALVLALFGATAATPGHALALETTPHGATVPEPTADERGGADDVGAGEAPGDAAPASQEAGGVSEPLIIDESHGDATLSDPQRVPEDAATGDSGIAPETHQQPSAPAPVTNRQVSGTVQFPAGMSLAQKQALHIYVSKPGQPGFALDYGQTGLDYEPTSANTAQFTVKNLEATKYYFTIDLRAAGFSSMPIYWGPWNAQTQQYDALDLTAGNATTGVLDANVGTLSLDMVSPYTPAGNYKLELVNVNGGSVKDVTKTVFAGDTHAAYPLRIHGFNQTPGTYRLRATLPNGIVTYYDGTPIGTRKPAEAFHITVSLFERTKLRALDLREFTDVPPSHTFYAPIMWMAKAGITTGVNQPDQSLRYLPNANVTRGSMTAFLFRIAEARGYQPSGPSPFVDVQPGAKFYTEIRWAYDQGIAAGARGSDGKLRFMPENPVNRGAMAAFISRMFGDSIPATGAAVNFSDVPRDHRFYNAIAWMSRSGLGVGAPQADGSVKFLPENSTNRGAMAAFLKRADAKSS